MGRRTRAALRRYQKAEGLAVTGRLDRATRAALEATSGAPTQPAVESPSGAAESAVGRPAPPVESAPAPAAERAAPAPPAAASGRVLSYRKLGWRSPASGKAILARFKASGDPPLMEHGIAELIVPDASKIYLLERGARVPGFDCDPAANRLSLNLLLGVGGPLSFRGLGEGGYCRIGFGILLVVGQTLRLEPSNWGNEALPGGRVRVGRRGLEYLR